MKEIKDNDLFIFINDCNANWLQGKLIEMLLRFDLSEYEFDKVEDSIFEEPDISQYKLKENK